MLFMVLSPMVYANIHIIAVFSRECKCFWRTRRRLGHTMRQGPTPENISTRFPMCNSCHSYRASGRCASSFMRALSNLFAVRGETTDDCTCNCGDTCSCGCSNCCESCTPAPARAAPASRAPANALPRPARPAPAPRVIAAIPAIAAQARRAVRTAIMPASTPSGAPM